MAVDSKFEYIITDAKAQCGKEPPYNLLNIPVRMNGEMPQIQIKNEWIDFPKDGPRPNIEKYYGLPLSGISSSWKLK